MDLSGYQIGRIVGMILWPILFGALIAFIYSKIRKVKFSWKVVLIAALVIFGIASLGRIGKYTSQTQEFNADFKTGLLDECQKNGYSTNVCNCWADKLAKSYSPSELTKITEDATSGKAALPETVTSTLQSCVSSNTQ